MDSEIPLPPPPQVQRRTSSLAVRTSASAAPFPISNKRTLRSLNDLPVHSSSDAPSFSSDDFPDASLDNYGKSNLGRINKKRRYHGTWWGETLDAKRKRSTFKEKRNLDSGVWMGSDASSSSFSCFDDSCEESLGIDRETPALPVNVVDGSEEAPSPDRPQVATEGSEARRIVGIPRIPPETEAHERARQYIDHCVEEGIDNVDLAYFDMRTMPTGLLQPLQHLIKQPTFKEAPQTEDAYTSLQPSLRLFLTRNLLTNLPAELFELQRLKVLSVRHNKLTQLPAALRNLTMLLDLNVAGNRLKNLPWEILMLIKKGDLQHITVHPNPFDQLNGETPVEEWHCQNEGDENIIENAITAVRYEDQPPPEAWAPALVATSPVQLLDSEGQKVPIKPGTQAAAQSEIPSTRVPTLRELALRECGRSPDLAPFLDSDPVGLPDPVLHLLSRAKEVTDAGGRCCSVCFRSFIIPRAEWIEWWDVETYENGLTRPRASGQRLSPLPFLRRGCSWMCVPNSEINEAETIV